MLRYQVFLSWAALWGAIWYQSMQSIDLVIEASPASPDMTRLLVNLLPLWILVALAFYAIFTILYGLATLGDFPQAAAELEKQIVEAKKEMKARGVPVIE
mmetsp:Transcript_4469/g.6634  ORF Transcript_4469/g.6634 Transcript_4469/m.6634 type:complete len:100 (+) Transcript_4469:256-555(+)